MPEPEILVSSRGLLIQLNLGQSFKGAPKRKWLNAQKRLRIIAATYETQKDAGEVLEYLRSIAHNIVL